jgi:DNA invertase Pin-like site-specific DNA recombinase
MNVAIYIRVSTEEQSIHGLSVETQRDVLTEYANSNDMNIVDYYVDAGLTARKKLSSRKELQRLLIDVENGFIDVIIFTKLDRWFRNIADYYKVQEILDKYKVNWKTIYEDYDTSTANGRLHINIMLSIAQDEADRTSERIKAVFENKRSRGETTSRHVQIGYKVVNSKILVDDETKQIAIDIFNHYDIHHSTMACVRLVQEKYNRKIYSYTIKRMFENTIYIGEFRGHKNFCEPLIDRDLFYRIKKYSEVREFKNQLKDGRVYLFSSLIQCKECKHNMSSCFTSQMQKSGLKEYHYYRCKEAQYANSCTHKLRANEDHIERFLLDHIKAELKDVIGALKRNVHAAKVKTIDVAKIRKRMDKLKDLYLDDLIDKSTYKLEYELLTKQISMASELPKPAVEKYKELINLNIEELYESLTLQERKAFWLGIIEKIVIDSDNNISFTLRV